MLFVIAGPSGIGKSYLMQQLIARYPGEFAAPKLYTTRQPRQSEQAIDRKFISQVSFGELQCQGKFGFVGEFVGNWYAFAEDDIASETKHVLINAWPAMLPVLAQRPEVVIIGMTTSSAGRELLAHRIRARGDAPEVFSQRMQRIDIDLADLAEHADLVSEHGKMFVIQDDSMVDTILSWICDNYLTKVGVTHD
ncbi:hypothetical protein H7097_00425 [Aeromicrobium sp.]|nr:hypothetical protein [Candidatus Saccharibacteria bacterium]